MSTEFEKLLKLACLITITVILLLAAFDQITL